MSAGCLPGYGPAVTLPWPVVRWLSHWLLASCQFCFSHSCQLVVSLVTGQLSNTPLNIKHPALLVVGTLCTCFSGCQTPRFTGQHFLYLLYRESNTLLYWSAPCVPALWGQTPHVSGQHLALWGVKHPALLVSTLCTCFMGSNTPRFWSAPCFMGCQTPCFTGQHPVYLLYGVKHPTFLVSTLLYGVSNTLLYWSAPCVPALWGQTPHVSGQHLALWGVKHPALLVSTLFTCFTDLKCTSSMLHITCGKCWFLCVKKCM